MASLFDVSLGAPEPTDQEISKALLGPWKITRRVAWAPEDRLAGLVDKRRRLSLRNLPRQSWNKFRVPAFPLAFFIEESGDQFLTKNCSPYVTHPISEEEDSQELQENGQQVFGNARKW